MNKKRKKNEQSVYNNYQGRVEYNNSFVMLLTPSVRRHSSRDMHRHVRTCAQRKAAGAWGNATPPLRPLPSWRGSQATRWQRLLPLGAPTKVQRFLFEVGEADHPPIPSPILGCPGAQGGYLGEARTRAGRPEYGVLPFWQVELHPGRMQYWHGVA